MQLPLQLTQVEKDFNIIEESLSYFYQVLDKPTPQVVKLANPLEFLSLFHLWPQENRFKDKGIPGDLGPSLNYRVWAFINTQVAKPLREGTPQPQAILPFMQKIREKQLVIHQALQRHLQQQTQPPVQGLEAHHPHYFDQQWANFHYQQVAKNESYEYLLRLLQSGLMMVQLYEKVAFWCPLPHELHFDEHGQLHCEDGPALIWKDLELFHWHGVEIPSALIQNPETITTQQVMQERNAEVRRCYQEILGAEKFAALFELEKVDSQTDRQGNTQTLYRTAHYDELAKDHLHFAKVICPTTGRNYFLCVPPDFKTIDQAVAWTFGKEPGDYHPDSET